MAEDKLYNSSAYADRRLNLLYPVAMLWGLVVFSIFAFYLFENGLHESLRKYYLLPWCFLTGAVILAPSAYLFFKKKFDPFHPLVFPAWTYFFPAFFIGGLILAFGISEPYYLAFVQDERYNLPLTLVYVILGFGGQAIGFFLPFGRKIGEKIANWLPVWEWKPEQVIKPAIILLGIGLFNVVIAFMQGLLGFQKVDENNAFDGTIFLFSMFWLQASFLLWLCIFRTEKLSVTHYLIVALLLGTSLAKSAFQGNRGSLIQVFVLVAFAFVFSGRKIEFKHKIISAVLLCFALVVGMIYGTTFRSIKGNQERMGMDEYAGVVVKTFEKLSEQDVVTVLENGFATMADRFEAVSSLAVVVSNYEKLETYEAGYGLDNNIWKDSISYLIPRVLWTDKTVAADAGKYGDLYFNYSENSFTLTPMGDLLRNFGPVGVPVGMLFLGFVIRILFSALRENQAFSFWRATLFYMLLISISYEGSYGLIIPYLIKIGFISIIGILIVRFFVGKTRAVF